MHIWLIKDGEKHGPHPDFHIRQGIENGQYDADTAAWHEGMDEWTTLGEIDLFKSALGESEPPESPPKEKPPFTWPTHSARTADPAAALTPAKLHLARRFWARMVDVQIYITACWLFLYFTNRDIGAILMNPWLTLMFLASWIPIEAALIYFHGTTPGKWLLGVRIRNDDGTALSGRQSAMRAFRVFVVGLGLGLPYLLPICLILSFWITQRMRRSIWDNMGAHRIDCKPLRISRYLAVVGIFFVISQLQVAVLAPHLARLYKEQMPELWEQFEKNPPRHFPERHHPPSR